MTQGRNTPDGSQSGQSSRPARLVDIAAHAAVSQKTVSRVLNNEPYVKQEMRDRVLASVEELGYVGDAMARGLRLRRSGYIGLIIPDIRNGFFALLTRALEERLPSTSPALLLGDSHDDIDQEERYLRAFRQQRVDGLVILPTGAPGLLHAVKEIPTVVVDRSVPALAKVADHVLPDNRHAAETLVGHMADHHGLEHIALVAGSTGISSVRDRQAGYTRVIKRAGLKPHITSGHTTPDEAALAAVQLFSTLPRPFGVLSTNNRMFWGVMAAIATLGLKVPDDVVVTTFDSIGEATVTGLVPTQAVIPVDIVATRALEMLAERMSDRSAPPRRSVVECKVDIGTTCGCIPLRSSPLMRDPGSRR